jgi:hypothetical protein
MTRSWWMRFRSGGPLPPLAAAMILAGLAWAGVRLFAHPPEPLTGTYYGTYTISARTWIADAVVLHLVQTGTRVTGSLKSEQRRRTARFDGEAHGARITGTLTFTDRCGGTATVTLLMIDQARRLDGSYDAQDCEGAHSGEFAVLYYWR